MRHDTLWQDGKHAVRTLRRAPAFTLASVVTLALGIGGTTAIFSVANALFFRPLPYPEPERVFVLTQNSYASSTGQLFHYVRDGVQSFETIAATFEGAGRNLVVGNQAEYVTAAQVTDGYFELLGIPPLLGRDFTRAESRPQGPQGVILSEALWRRRFDARSDVIGRVIELGGVPYAVVGVVPERPVATAPADVWTPLQLSPDDDTWNYTVLGRLRANVSPTRAQNELEVLHATMVRELGEDEFSSVGRTLAWTPYRESLVRDRRTEVLVLLAAVGFLLAIACANIAGLQLARGLGRRREMATRLALGGSKRRLARQVLTESVLLGLGGGLLGLAVARFGTQGVLALMPGGGPPGEPVGLDGRVLLVTATISLVTGLLVGLAPALDSGWVDLRSFLSAGTRHTISRHTAWLRRGFVVVEVALAVLLLAGAGVLVRTFVNLRSVPLGIDPENVVTGSMSLLGTDLGAHGGSAQFFERTLARIRELPGVEGAAVGSDLPVEWGLNLALEPPPGGIVESPSAVDWRYITREYFTLFRVPLRGGRVFDERDGVGSAPVAIVNETFGKRYFGRTDVVGEHIQLATGGLEDFPRRIVGVVADVKSGSRTGWSGERNALAAPPPPILYVPVAQVSAEVSGLVHEFVSVDWIVRTREPGTDLIPAIQDIVRTAEPTLPFIRFQTMDEVVAAEMETERDHMLLVGLFALMAMVLAGVGIYGLIAYGVSQRTQEVGVRMALGATAEAVLGRFLREGLALALAGVVLGLGGAALLSRALESFVWGVDPLDPLTYATVAALLLVIAALASLAPALRAARLDPTRALRQE